MAIDGGEAAIRTIIAGAILESDEISGRPVDALLAMRHAELFGQYMERHLRPDPIPEAIWNLPGTSA